MTQIDLITNSTDIDGGKFSGPMTARMIERKGVADSTRN